MLDVDTIESLQQEVAAVSAERDALRAQLAKNIRRYENLLIEFDKLKKKIIGPKRESLRNHEAQLSILDLLKAIEGAKGGDEDAIAAAEEALDALRSQSDESEKKPPRAKKKSKNKGRRKLSGEDLPVTRVVIEPPERLAPGGENLQLVGEEVTEYIEHLPTSKIRVQMVRPKYVAPDVERYAPNVDDDDVKAKRFVIADLPQLPIPRCLAGPGLLAHVLVSKYADHLPLHRQARIFKREGLGISTSTLGDWTKASTALLLRIVNAMWEDARDNASYALTDATGVLVRQERECKRGTFYVVITPKQHVLFRFLQKNNGKTVADLLRGFSGYLQADAAQVYHELYRQEDLIEVGCLCHGRRGFFEAIPTDPERALIAIGYISRLYDVQRATWDPEKGIADVNERARLARPILARFLRWVRLQLRSVDDPSPIRSALIYIRNQRKPLLRFLKDGRLRLDNNPSELELRRLVVGRKNWLFCGSDSGAEWAATAVSLIASCQMHGIEPWAYLRDVLTLLPHWSQKRVLELSPMLWASTSAKPDTIALLDRVDMLRRAEAQGSPA